MSSTSQWESLDTRSLCERSQPPSGRQATALERKHQRGPSSNSFPVEILQFTCSLRKFHVVELMFVMSGVDIVVFVFYTLKKRKRTIL